jgi:hypothetical protein
MSRIVPKDLFIILASATYAPPKLRNFKRFFDWICRVSPQRDWLMPIATYMNNWQVGLKAQVATLGL